MPVTLKPEGSDYTTEEIIDNREAWVSALRSGEYKQGTGHLNRENKLCCLGVASAVLGSHATQYVSASGVAYTSYDTNVSLPPENINEALGLRLTTNGSHLDRLSPSDLVEMNDVLGATFLQIADVIDKDTNTYLKAKA